MLLRETDHKSRPQGNGDLIVKRTTSQSDSQDFRVSEPELRSQVGKDQPLGSFPMHGESEVRGSTCCPRRTSGNRYCSLRLRVSNDVENRVPRGSYSQSRRAEKGTRRGAGILFSHPDFTPVLSVRRGEREKS